MKAYKILKERDGKILSPYLGFEYELGKEYVCKDFDDNKDNDCSHGFYAVDLKGLLYRNLSRTNEFVYEVEVSGKSVDCGFAKTRYEKQTVLRKIPMDEVKELVKNYDCDFDLYHALFPVNPLEIEFNGEIDKAIKLLQEWQSVRDSVRESVWESVRESVWDSVWGSVWDFVRESVWDSVRESVWDSAWVSVWGSVRESVRDSVRDSVRESAWGSVRGSVRDSVYAYIGALFSNMKKWKHIDHKEGEYPFQSAVDLWHMGIVPSFNGGTWRLHTGKDAKVIYEISREELRSKNE